MHPRRDQGRGHVGRVSGYEQQSGGSYGDEQYGDAGRGVGRRWQREGLGGRARGSGYEQQSGGSSEGQYGDAGRGIGREGGRARGSGYEQPSCGSYGEGQYEDAGRGVGREGHGVRARGGGYEQPSGGSYGDGQYGDAGRGVGREGRGGRAGHGGRARGSGYERQSGGSYGDGQYGDAGRGIGREGHGGRARGSRYEQQSGGSSGEWQYGDAGRGVGRGCQREGHGGSARGSADDRGSQEEGGARPGYGSGRGRMGHYGEQERVTFVQRQSAGPSTLGDEGRTRRAAGFRPEGGSQDWRVQVEERQAHGDGGGGGYRGRHSADPPGGDYGSRGSYRERHGANPHVGDHGDSVRGRDRGSEISASSFGIGASRGRYESEAGTSTNAARGRTGIPAKRASMGQHDSEAARGRTGIPGSITPGPNVILPPAVESADKLSKATREQGHAASEIPGPSQPTMLRYTLVAPPRPSPGKIGKAAQVHANHFRVTLHPQDNICQYDVEISPKVSSKALARRLKQQLISLNPKEFGVIVPVYDGSKSMYTPVHLPFKSKEFSVLLKDERGEKTFSVAVRHVATLDGKELDEFLGGRQVANPQVHLQALDIALRESLIQKYTPVGRCFYTENLGKAALEGGLVAWNGFYQSLRPTQQGLALNVDISTTAFYDSIPVIKFLTTKVPRFEPNKTLSDASEVRKALGRLKVEVTHRQTPQRYRISGLSPLPTRDLKFSREGGEETSIVDYFQHTYNYQIKYLQLPCLQVEAKGISYLPMEVCNICKGQRFTAKLDDSQTSALLKHACVKPHNRKSKIESIMLSNDGPGRDNFVSNFGMEVARDLSTVTARLLPPPKLRYVENGGATYIGPGNGAWNLNKSCVNEAGTVSHWALINFDSKNVNDALASTFISDLARRCSDIGVRLAPETVIRPQMMDRRDLEGENLERDLEHVCKRASDTLRTMKQPGQLQLLVCVLGQKNPAYGTLKRICETKIGIITQCCLSKHIQMRTNRSLYSQYLANLALKINAKAGGMNTRLAIELPEMCEIFKDTTMILGADVTHPNPGDDTAPSIAAVVANTDWPSAIKYAARVWAQSRRVEIIENFKEMVQELWRAFCKKTRSTPQRIIMFRDGVSEGQFDTVLQQEVAALKDALMEVSGRPDYQPPITWVVVQKRHHTRFFPAADSEYQDHAGNILAGTVVDTVITHPREFDFYLCSHGGLQGTSKPTHYHVLYDEIGFSSDQLQGMINDLCYTYARCTRSLSVVPPAHYAHLAAYRARLYLEAQGGSDAASHHLPSILPQLQDSMYFC